MRAVRQADPLKDGAGRFRGTIYAVPMNAAERALCRRAVLELAEREGTTATTLPLLELLDRAITIRDLRRALSAAEQ